MTGQIQRKTMFNKHTKIFKYTSHRKNSNSEGPLFFTHDEISEQRRRALAAGLGKGMLSWPMDLSVSWHNFFEGNYKFTST